ncbi:MAG TPA: mechanosensitive ion channel family protein [Thermoplasmata archaeon]|nr:mechanosensitive ion channel family protein [Thermoplasmata archaeon]
MAARPPAEPRPLQVLFRDLVLALCLGVALYAVFTLLNHFVLDRFNALEILLLEAGAIVLVAYVVARSVSAATNALIARRGGMSRAPAIRIFLNLLVAVGATLALFKLAGVSIESIFLGSALAGIVLGLAAQTVLANVFSGLLLILADPFRPGDRVSFVSSSYGAIGPSYAHDMMYPSYTGVVEDVGLIYTTLRLAGGEEVRVPNGVVLGALVLKPTPGLLRSCRIRMTFPWAIAPATVESALARLPPTPTLAAHERRPPTLQVVDISATSWDASVIVWTRELDDTVVRDQVLRTVFAAAVPPPK